MLSPMFTCVICLTLGIGPVYSVFMGKQRRKQTGRRENLIASVMAEMGRRGARKRAALLTPERRSQIARLGAQARWAKARKRPGP